MSGIGEKARRPPPALHDHRSPAAAVSATPPPATDVLSGVALRSARRARAASADQGRHGARDWPCWRGASPPSPSRLRADPSIVRVHMKWSRRRLHAHTASRNAHSVSCKTSRRYSVAAQQLLDSRVHHCKVNSRMAGILLLLKHGAPRPTCGARFGPAQVKDEAQEKVRCSIFVGLRSKLSACRPLASLLARLVRESRPRLTLRGLACSQAQSGMESAREKMHEAGEKVSGKAEEAKETAQDKAKAQPEDKPDFPPARISHLPTAASRTPPYVCEHAADTMLSLAVASRSALRSPPTSRAGEQEL